MSIENAAAFANKVMGDAELASLVESTISNKSGAEAATAVSNLAESHGYDFTPEEAAAVSGEIERLRSGAINEDDLAAVAGGVNIVGGLSSAGNTVGMGVLQASYYPLYPLANPAGTQSGLQTAGSAITNTAQSAGSAITGAAKTAGDAVASVFKGW